MKNEKNNIKMILIAFSRPHYAPSLKKQGMGAQPSSQELAMQRERRIAGEKAKVADEVKKLIGFLCLVFAQNADFPDPQEYPYDEEHSYKVALKTHLEKKAETTRNYAAIAAKNLKLLWVFQESFAEATFQLQDIDHPWVAKIQTGLCQVEHTLFCIFLRKMQGRFPNAEFDEVGAAEMLADLIFFFKETGDKMDGVSIPYYRNFVFFLTNEEDRKSVV